jgi:Flp pilus assembly protein TadG
MKTTIATPIKITRASQGRCMKSASADFMKWNDQRGGALIEFAIVLPLLLLLVGGIVDFGILFYNKQVLTNASREGARAGIVYQLDSAGNKIIPDIEKIVSDYCNDNGDQKLWTFGEYLLTTTTSNVALIYPADLTVTVSFKYTFLMSSLLNIFGGNFGPNLDISAVTIMKME